jgi:hypothetical protein
LTANEEPWIVSHDPRVWRQHEARPGPPQADGARWVERRLTGMGAASCSCGYTTGLVPRDQLPDAQQFAAEHPPYGGPDSAGGAP